MLTRTKPLKRTAIRRAQRKRAKSQRTSPDATTVLTVLGRAYRTDVGLNCCEICGAPVSGERGIRWSVHHRRGRDGRADTHTPQNLLLVCGASNVDGCHGRIHRRRSEAEPNGWWISRIPVIGGDVTDPRTVPVLIDHESRWVYLTPFAWYSDSPPGGET